MLPSSAAAPAAASSRTTTEAAGKTDAPPALPEDNAAPLSTLSETECAALRERIGAISRSANPVREQLVLRSLLLAGMSSAEDFARALSKVQA